MFAAFLLFLFRLSPPVVDSVHEGSFMSSFTFLDRDRVEFNATSRDLFVAVQPHHMTGGLFSSVIDSAGSHSLVKHRPGDRFRVRDVRLSMNFTYRGGAIVHAWQIPTGLCGERSVFSGQQREALIDIDEEFDRELNMCWFLQFRGTVNYSVKFAQSGVGSELTIMDDEAIKGNTSVVVRSGETAAGVIGNSHIIALRVTPGRLHLRVVVSSNAQFGDWTDMPSKFMPRGDVKGRVMEDEMYVKTRRDVATWIWLSLASSLAGTFAFTVVFFFVRPIRKISTSLSNSDDLSKLAKKNE